MSPQVPQVKEQGHLLPITVTLSFPDRSDHVSDDHGVMMIIVLIILFILTIVIPAQGPARVGLRSSRSEK